jgi:hypothetical protein
MTKSKTRELPVVVVIVATVLRIVWLAVDACVVVQRVRGYWELQKDCAAGTLASGVKRAIGNCEHVLAAA